MIFDKNGTVYMIILNIFPKFLLNQHFISDILGIIQKKITKFSINYPTKQNNYANEDDNYKKYV